MVAGRILAFVVVFLCAICSQSRRRKRIQVRLEGGTQPYAGRVMVFYRGVWGSVCENGWSKKNAATVCRQLGYKGVVLATKGTFFGQQRLYVNERVGSRYVSRRTRIWLDRVECNGREYNLGYCRHKPWAQIRCSRQRLAGVMCDPGLENLVKSPPLHNATKNVDIKKFKLDLWPKDEKKEGIITEGLLIVKYDDTEAGLVCSEGWELKESRVACGELGFTHALESTMPSTTTETRNIDELRKIYSPGLAFHLGKVECTGNEATILSCKSSGLRHQHCPSGQALWLKCETRKPPFAHAKLRGGVHFWEGRVEVRKSRHWGTLCDKDLDIHTANVICRSLGYGTAKEYVLGSVYPHAMFDTKIYEKIICSGKETYLQNCVWGERQRKSPCKHYNDAGVRCNVPLRRKQRNKMEVRLKGAGHYTMGRVNVMFNGKWGDICGERWTMKNSIVVCRQLGLGYAAGNWSTSNYGSSGKIHFSGVTCLGHEDSLDDCLRHHNVTCANTKRLGAVKCKDVAPDLVWDIKELASTMSVRTFPIIALRCAHEERCLASTADADFNDIRLARAWFGHRRRLLRFSAKVHNVGTAAYRPYKSKNSWIWHTCHQHYHSDEEFALYDLIDPHTHKKVAEGHKASYCLEDSTCDNGVDQFYFCRDGGDQGISVNCHDNYDHTLDCQWVDVTDLTVQGRSYKLRLVANPSFKVGESDYSNNVVLCDVMDRINGIQVGECIRETCESGVRSHHGNGNYACCHFPFTYDGKSRDTCVLDDKSGQFWCATSQNYDQDGLFGYC